MTSHSAIIELWDGTTREAHIFLLPRHSVVTGKEDHFALAVHDANQILKGLMFASADNCVWEIKAVSA